MQAIIDGLRYDTDSAELIGEIQSVSPPDHPAYWRAGLYVTDKGRFFLAGAGGPESPFRQKTTAETFSWPGMRGRGGLIPPWEGWIAGESIKRMLPDEARAWVNAFLPPDVVFPVRTRSAVEEA
jgi:hypothetical protein